jgi:hypothetical protein
MPPLIVIFRVDEFRQIVRILNVRTFKRR